MGAAAFIMSEYTGVEYVDIAFAAVIPVLLHYLPIYLQVHLRADRLGLRGIDAGRPGGSAIDPAAGKSPGPGCRGRR